MAFSRAQFDHDGDGEGQEGVQEDVHRPGMPSLREEDH